MKRLSKLIAMAVISAILSIGLRPFILENVTSYHDPVLSSCYCVLRSFSSAVFDERRDYSNEQQAEFDF